MAEYITHSREETVALGRKLAAVLPDGALIAFTGGLGAGKTAFCEGLAEGLGCTDPVSSPTFAIVNYYRGPRPLAHFDLYASPPRTTCVPPVFTIIWIRVPLWPLSGAKTSPICWPRKTQSTSTLTGWTTPPAASPSRGSAYEYLSRRHRR